MSAEAILKMLAKQNIKLGTDLWKVFYRHGTPEGQSAVTGLNMFHLRQNCRVTTLASIPQHQEKRRGMPRR